MESNQQEPDEKMMDIDEGPKNIETTESQPSKAYLEKKQKENED